MTPAIDAPALTGTPGKNIKVVYIIAVRQCRRNGWLVAELTKETGLSAAAIRRITNSQCYDIGKTPFDDTKLEQWFTTFGAAKGADYDSYLYEKGVRNGLQTKPDGIERPQALLHPVP